MNISNEEFLAKCKQMNVTQLEQLIATADLTDEQYTICKKEINSILDYEKYDLEKKGKPKKVISKEEKSQISNATGDSNTATFTDVTGSITENNQINTIARISLAGGLIGALTTNPRRALNKTIEDYNARGWKAIQVESHKTHNLFIFLLQFLVLILTLGLYTWGGGYLVLFEKIK